MVRKNILFVTLLLLAVIISCDSPKSVLLNRTKVPLDNKVFNHKQNLMSISKDIDTLTLYEEFRKSTYISGTKKIEVNLPERLNTVNSQGMYSAYKFYGNGCINLFFFDKNDSLTKEMLNPKFDGYRGIVFKQDNKLVMMRYVEVGEMGNFGLAKTYFRISGDTLILDEYPYYFIKRKLPKEWFTYKADW